MIINEYDVSVVNPNLSDNTQTTQRPKIFLTRWSMRGFLAKQSFLFLVLAK